MSSVAATAVNLMVDASDVRKNYRTRSGMVAAVAGVSLQLERGRFVALMGPSGSGKTTLLQLFGGIMRPDRGHLVVANTNLAVSTPARLTAFRRHYVGFVFQAFNLLPRLRVSENVELPLRLQGLADSVCRARAHAALEQVGLIGRAKHLPSELSGGEQQRVAIARAVVHDPHLLLADEPTGNLDSANGRVVCDLIAQLNRNGLTVILSTHNPEVAARADERVVLRDGARCS